MSVEIASKSLMPKNLNVAAFPAPLTRRVVSVKPKKPWQLTVFALVNCKEESEQTFWFARFLTNHMLLFAKR